MSRNLGTLTSWNPLGHSRPVTGLLYLYTDITRNTKHFHELAVSVATDLLSSLFYSWVPNTTLWLYIVEPEDFSHLVCFAVSAHKQLDFSSSGSAIQEQISRAKALWSFKMLVTIYQLTNISENKSSGTPLREPQISCCRTHLLFLQFCSLEEKKKLLHQTWICQMYHKKKINLQND
jgi:hypothetical protein